MAEEKVMQEQDLGQLRAVRREKLAQLQAEGRDPAARKSHFIHRTQGKEEDQLKVMYFSFGLAAGSTCISVKVRISRPSPPLILLHLAVRR